MLHFLLHRDLKQAPSALRKNIGILGYRGSRELEERAKKIPGRAKKREGLVSSLYFTGRAKLLKSDGRYTDCFKVRPKLSTVNP